MKTRGFTLIELIGTIVIISLAMLIIVPIVSKSMKAGIEDADKKVIKNIELAAENYVMDNGYVSCVLVSTLQSQGYIDENIKKPSTSSTMSGKVTVGKTTTGSKKIKYTYTYVETSNVC